MRPDELTGLVLGPAGYPKVDDTAAFQGWVKVTQSEGHTRATLASIFWSIYIESNEWISSLRALMPRDSRDIQWREEESMVVSRGITDMTHYDLLVLHPRVQGEPLGFVLPPIPSRNLLETAVRWRDNNRVSQAILLRQRQDELPEGTHKRFDECLAAVDKIDPEFVYEMLSVLEPGVVIARKPRTEFTCVPSPFWAAATDRHTPASSTVGVVGRNKAGQVGVTCCLHGIAPDLDPNDAYKVIGAKVWIDGREGSVISADGITDSVFVMLPNLGTANFTSPPSSVRGPLTGVCPRQKERVHFEGLTSGVQNTEVMSHDLGIPRGLRGDQLRVYTPAATSPGDSGSALVDGDGKVLGVCYQRTGIGEPIEWASWMWAQSVYEAHDLDTVLTPMTQLSERGAVWLERRG